MSCFPCLSFEHVSCSVMFNSLWPHELWLTRLLCPWKSSDKNTGMSSHSFLWGTQESNLSLACGFFTVWATREAWWASQLALVVKNLPTNAADARFDPWVRKMPWNRKWQPAQIFLPGKFHGQRSLAGYSPWSWRKSDITGRLNNKFWTVFSD